MYIKLHYVGVCAHDQHEMTLHPRQGYKPKPCLRIGTVLQVKDCWQNFYGSYYRCLPPEGMPNDSTNPDYYDIPTYIANITSGPASKYHDAITPKPQSTRRTSPWQKIKLKISSFIKSLRLKTKW